MTQTSFLFATVQLLGKLLIADYLAIARIQPNRRRKLKRRPRSPRFEMLSQIGQQVLSFRFGGNGYWGVTEQKIAVRRSVLWTAQSPRV